jgi:hypothetical protein
LQKKPVLFDDFAQKIYNKFAKPVIDGCHINKAGRQAVRRGSAIMVERSWIAETRKFGLGGTRVTVAIIFCCGGRESVQLFSLNIHTKSN